MRGEGFEPPNSLRADLESVSVGHLDTHAYRIIQKSMNHISANREHTATKPCSVCPKATIYATKRQTPAEYKTTSSFFIWPGSVQSQKMMHRPAAVQIHARTNSPIAQRIATIILFILVQLYVAIFHRQAVSKSTKRMAVYAIPRTQRNMSGFSLTKSPTKYIIYPN